MRRAAIGLVLGAVVLAATPAAAGELRPAGEASAEKAARAAKDLKLGKPGKVRTGPGEPPVTVVVSSAQVMPPADGRSRTLVVSLRVENPSSKATEVPNIGVICAGEDGEQPHYVESTVSAGEDLPAKSFLEGVQVAAYPEGCEQPTFRVFPFVTVGSKPRAVEYPLGLP